MKERRDPLRAEIGSPKSIKLYRGAALIGHVYTADPTFGWRVNHYADDRRPSAKQWPTPEDAAHRAWGVEGRDAVAAAFAARAAAAAGA